MSILLQLKSIFNFFLNSPIGISILAAISTAGFCFYNHKNGLIKLIMRISFVSIFVIVVVSFLSTIKFRLFNFQIWDFTSFYLWANVAVQGQNFYLPEASQLVFGSLELPNADFKDFIEGIVNVGFLFPPPTLFYFYILGFFNYETALMIWTCVILLFLIGSMTHVYKHWFIGYKISGLLLVVTLFLLFPSVKFTIICSQTNFILLFWFLLLFHFADQKYAGIFLALAFLTKPFMLIFGLYFLISKNWKAIVYFIGTGGLLSIVSIIAFGTNTFISYFTNNPTQRLPHWQYSEDINQSLHAILLRAGLISLDSPVIYLVIFLTILVSAFVYSIYLFRRNLKTQVWVVLMLTGLLIYPGTLSYYSVILLFIILPLVVEKIQLPALIIPSVGFFYYLSTISVFALISFLFVIVLVDSIMQTRKIQLFRVFGLNQ